MDRVDLKQNLVHLLCLCNFSYRNKFLNLRFKIKRAVLTESIDYYQEVIPKKEHKMIKSQPIFHDLQSLK